MANKSISDLLPVNAVGSTDLFVLQQGNKARSVPAGILIAWVTAAADGHGGIQKMELVSTNGLVNTWRMSLADGTFIDIPIADGRGITNFERTKTEGLVNTWTATFNDGSFLEIPIADGAKGDTGESSNLWIRYASQHPSIPPHSIGTVPDEWIGFYTALADQPPQGWEDYAWYRIRGDKGDTGDPAAVVGNSITYQASDSGVVVPSGAWLTDVPSVTQGRFLWTKVEIRFNNGDPVVMYAVSHMGLDGNGAVNTVNLKAPDAQGNVQLSGSDIMVGADTLANALDAKQAKTRAVGILVGDGSGGINPAVPGKDYQSPAKAVTVTLASSGWSGLRQTVTATGVTEDESACHVIVSPAPAEENYTAWNQCGIRCVAQGTDTLTFSCESAPGMDITAHILIIGK